MLISCNTCGKQIAASAETCPSCGAKNKFIHPRIQDFLNKKNSLDIAEFDYWHNSHTLHGKRDKDQVGLKVMGGGIIAVIAGTFTFGFLSVLGLVAMAVGLGMSLFSKSPEFVADFSVDPPKWSTNNEEFWKPVKDQLGIL